MLLHPALVAPVLGRVHGRHPRQSVAACDPLRGRCHQPVVRVDERELGSVAQLVPERVHVVVHLPDPVHERAGVLWERRLADAVDGDPVPVLLGGKVPAPGQHVHLESLGDQMLGQLADVTGEAAFDHGRVLPRDQQGAHRAGRDAI